MSGVMATSTCFWMKDIFDPEEQTLSKGFSVIFVEKTLYNLDEAVCIFLCTLAPKLQTLSKVCCIWTWKSLGRSATIRLSLVYPGLSKALAIP